MHVSDEDSRRILLVEDEAIIALSEKVMLERNGYAVTLAHSGEQAIDASRRNDDIDLILMDVNLGPGMDGTVTAQAILSERELPVVFLSSHTEPEVVDQTEKITSYGYIVKSSGETVVLASIRMAFRLFEARVNERRALRRLTHSRDLMSYIIAHARSAIAVHDRNLNYLYVSEEYLNSYEVESGEVIGRHHYEVFPDLPQKWREVHQRSLRGEIISAADDVYERTNGQKLWTRWESRPWYEDDGSIGGIIINTEITDRTQRLRRTFVNNRDFHQALLETASEGFCVVDSRGSILEVNRALCSITGHTADELYELSIWDVDVQDDEQAVRSRMERLREQGPEAFRSRLTGRDGVPVEVDVSVTALSGEPQTYIAMFRPTDPPRAV